jgi:hypothetical protein
MNKIAIYNMVETNKAVVPKDFTNTLGFSVNHFNDGSKESSISFTYNIEEIYPFDMVFERVIDYPLVQIVEVYGKDVGDNFGVLAQRNITYTINIDIDSTYFNHYRFFRFLLSPNIIATRYGNGPLSFELKVNIISDDIIKDSITNQFEGVGNVMSNTYGSGKTYRAKKYSFIYDSLNENLTDDTENGTDAWGDLFDSTVSSESIAEE